MGAKLLRLINALSIQNLHMVGDDVEYVNESRHQRQCSQETVVDDFKQILACFVGIMCSISVHSIEKEYTIKIFA